MWILIKQYLWPFSLPGVEEISEEGRMFTKEKIDNFSKGDFSLGSETYSKKRFDDEIRHRNRVRLLPHLHTYARRWGVIGFALYFSAWLASKQDVFVIEVIGTIGALTAWSVGAFILWLHKDGVEAEK